MSRPMSRGPMPGPAGPGPSRGGLAAMPPGTGMRGPATGAAPGTAMRPGSNRRQGTALRQAPMGVGMTTDVKVAERPMTQQGVTGMKTGAQGPGRQIYDRSYYNRMLRQKCDALNKEISRLRKQIESIQNDNTMYATLEKRYDQLITAVRQLEGDLADYNLALDKQRTDTRPEEVQYLFMILKNQNDQQRNEMDSIFLEKKQQEELIKKMEEEMDQIRKASEDRLNELHPDQRDEYEQLQQEGTRLAQEIQQCRNEQEEINNRLSTAEGLLRSDLPRMRASQLKEVKADLEARLSVLEEEAQEAKLSIPEQQERLRNKVKQDNQDIVNLERKTQEVKQEVARYQRQLAAMKENIEGKAGEGADQEKYELLETKNQEMTAFIEQFPQQKEEEEKKIAEQQKNIVSMLERIAKNIGRENHLPSADRVRDMEDELEFKSNQLKASETTASRLQAELDKRSGELQKINSLDNKISAELEELEARIKEYQHEMAEKFDKLDDLKAEKEAQMERLEAKKAQLKSRNEVLQMQVQLASTVYKGKEEQLKANETHGKLEDSEKKLKQYKTNLFHLKKYIAEKTSESDYSAKRQSVMDMADNINQLLIKQTNAAVAGGLDHTGNARFH
mmetsp:Transcript_2090/g.5020  ORF Transcript_2090/g.5020 Transcript_2090/m.5020 type:complete len:619 (-) Transcript_2090:173-2029(-)